MLFFLLTVLILQFLSAQGSYDLIIEDVDLAFHDEEYFSEPDAFVDENNAIVVNISVIKKLPVEAQGRFALFGASMGEYVIDTGIDVTLDLCEILDEPIMIGPLFAALGFRADKCPPDVGNYGNDGYKIPMESLPDEFPPNKYRVILELKTEEKKLLIGYIFPVVH